MSERVSERIAQQDTSREYDHFLHGYRYKLARRAIAASTSGMSRRPRLLDCACGNGYASRLLSAVGDYTGVDVSSAAIAQAKASYGRYGEFIALDGRKLPFPDGHFDAVCSMETIEHLPRESHGEFVGELMRVLGVGGTLVISTPNRNHLFKRYMQRRGWRNPYHLYEYDRRELIDFLRAIAAPLRIESRAVLGFPIPLPMRKTGIRHLPVPVARLLAESWIRLGQVVPGWADSIFVVGRKGPG